ncbi:MAG TPA: serine/threonine-protein kinase [Pyrinomonadaceae bacterium]|jgi:serine/threonine protein kinase
MDVPHIIAGRFRTECEIGTGGMGTVYRATHLGLERPVAVKIIKPEFAADRDVTERFMREARTMARLRHPHAAMIFDAGNLPDGRHFIVMEFVEGATLSEALAREGRFTPERAVQIASDICDVLMEAHQLGIIHRDLKPSNIMLNERGVCVLDFGVAKVLATSADSTSTHATTGSGAIVGTPRYMSPEQCLGQKVGVRSDLYSLGVLLYEMLAGRPPFVDLLPSAVLVKQATAQPPPLPGLRRDVPRPLALAVHKMLAKRPEDRPSNAASARTLLERSLTRPERVAPEVEPLASTIQAVNSRRSIAFRVVTPALIIGVLGFGLMVWARDRLNEPPTAESQSSPLLASASALSSRDASSYAAKKPLTLPAPTVEAARRVADSISRGPIGDVRVVRKGRGTTAIAAIHDERRAGTSHLFVMERLGTRYRVTGHAPLDAKGFRGANWTAESMDVDGDGYDEVLCTGTNAKNSNAGCRIVLYVPRTHQTYTLSVESKTARGRKSVRLARWSSNALTRTAAPYRAALQQHVRTLNASL